MKFLKLIPIFFIFCGIFPLTNSVYSESSDTKNYKVLSSSNKKLSIFNVIDYINKGDTLIKNADFNNAKIFKWLFQRDRCKNSS